MTRNEFNALYRKAGSSYARLRRGCASQADLDLIDTVERFEDKFLSPARSPRTILELPVAKACWEADMIGH